MAVGGVADHGVLTIDSQDLEGADVGALGGHGAREGGQRAGLVGQRRLVHLSGAIIGSQAVQNGSGGVCVVRDYARGGALSCDGRDGEYVGSRFSDRPGNTGESTRGIVHRNHEFFHEPP